MPKVDLELVKMAMQRNCIRAADIEGVIDTIKTEIASEEEAEKQPAVKKQFCILVSDPKGELEGKDFVGWVLQIPEDDSPFVAEERLIRAAYEFNITPKGRRLPVKTIAEVCEHVSTRITKEQGVWIKTKEPAYVLRTCGRIPLDEVNKKMRRANQAAGGDEE
ncbi:MAG: hypothetical protein WC378_09085 [Opitutaceae bacterium]|jgi:hypothetical protein